MTKITKKRTRGLFILSLFTISLCFMLIDFNDLKVDDSINLLGEDIKDMDQLNEEPVSAPQASANEISVITPENRTYTEPMSGYFPATYGFECDKAGDNPKSRFNENWVTNEGSGKNIEVISELGGHKKVLMLESEAGEAAYIYQDCNKLIENGIIELYIRTNDAGEYSSFDTREYVGGGEIYVNFRIQDNAWRYNPGTGPITIEKETGGYFDAPLANHWYHIKLAFESTDNGFMGLSQYRFKLWINGTESKELRYSDEAGEGMTTILFIHYPSTSAYKSYMDALSYSWDPNYNLGDNLKEGLLLSMTNSTNLNITSYSLDGGAEMEIIGNHTIPMPSDGSHNIQVFGNDSWGNAFSSDKMGFTISCQEMAIEGTDEILSVKQLSTNQFLEWKITGAFGGNYTIWRNGSKFKSDSYTTGDTVSVEIDTSSAGFWNYTIKAEDTMENNATHMTIVHVIGMANPQIIGLSEDFSILQGSYGSFSWKIISEAPEYYQIHLNGTLIETRSYVNGTSLNYTFTNTTLGGYRYIITAYDTLGHSSSAEIIVSVVERTDGLIFLLPNTMITLDLTIDAGVYIELETTEIAFLRVERSLSKFEDIENIWGNVTPHYFYSFKIYDQKMNDDDSIIKSMKIYFYYNTEQVNNPENLHILHYVFGSGNIWIWKAMDITIDENNNCIIMSTTELSYYCLAEIENGGSPIVAFIMDNLLFIVILSTISFTVPTVYVVKSKKSGKKKKTSIQEKKTTTNYKEELSEEEIEQMRLAEKARHKRERIESRTWQPETKKLEPQIKAKKKAETAEISHKLPKNAKKKSKQELVKPKTSEIEKLQKEKELEKTESEMEIKEKLDRCTIHKGPIEGMSYICPKCHAKYCENCARTLKQRNEGCWVCDLPIKLRLAEGDLDIEEVPLQKRVLDDLQQLDSETKQERVVLNAASILKVWLLDSKDNSEIYDELLDSQFLSEDYYDLILPQILKEAHEKDKFIEKAYNIGKKQVYTVLYFSSYFTNIIILSKLRLDTIYHEKLRNLIHVLEENFVENKKAPHKIKKALNEQILLYLARKYSQLSPEKDMALNNIFTDEAESDLIKSEVTRVPDDTFTEFLELYGRLTEEMKEIDRKRNTSDEDFIFE